MKNYLFKAFFGILLTIGTFDAYGHAIKPNTLAKEQIEKAYKKLEEHKAYLASQKAKGITQPTPIPDPAFQGWWKMELRGDESGFGLGALTDDIDAYVFIDLSTFNPVTNPFVTIDTVCGTPTFPRQCTPLDVGSGITMNLYYVPSSTELVNVMDLNGPAFNPINGQSWWSLKLQPDKKSIVVSSDSQPQFQGLGAAINHSNLLRKIISPPPIRPYDDTGTPFPSASDPVNMAKYIHNALLLNYNPPQNIHLNDTDYRCFTCREEIFQKMLKKGITFETKIRKVRVTHPGLHDVNAFRDETSNLFFTSTDTLTDIFTEEFSFATAGSTVEIKGFKGKWAKMNGIYKNGVALNEEGGVPNPSPEHIDVSSTYDPQRGTFRNVYNHFLLDLDSSDCEQFPRDELGWATEVEGDPVVKVTHRFSSGMQYPAFYAAIRALFFLSYRVSQHNFYLAYFAPHSVFLFDTWNELKNAAATNNFWASSSFPGNNVIETRTSQSVPSGFYNNVVASERRSVTTYNDPFGLTQLPGSKYDYNIVLANYIVKPKNLYWAIAGTPTGRTQFNPVEVGYKPTIPGSQPAEFVGTLGDIQVVDGKPVPKNPDPTHYSIYGSFLFPNNDVRNANAYYVGLIDPSLTNGKRVGYLRWIDEQGFDPKMYMGNSTFPPKVPVTVKYGREAYSQVIANFTRYLQTDLDCDAVILDWRSNNGGVTPSEFNLAEFFGDDRAAFTAVWTKKDDGFSPLINLADPLKFSSYNNFISLNSQSFARFYVRQNEANYGPGAVFRGTAERPKKVVVLTDNAAESAGDVLPHLFLGENLDGNLGSYTTSKIIGDIDGRLKGNASALNPMPVSEFKNIYYSSDGLPFSPIYYVADLATEISINGLTNIFYNQQSDRVAPDLAPCLRGTAGGAPLPNDWETTVWPDIGLIPIKSGHFSSQIKKCEPCFNDRRTWRDSWLEQAILEAIDIR